jgi:cell division protein FtsZ
LNISGDEKMTMQEVSEAATIIYNATNGHADIRFGTTKDRNLKDAIRVTVIATGIEESLPRIIDVMELLNSDELFPIKRRVHKGEHDIIDKNNLEIPTFLRRQID